MRLPASRIGLILRRLLIALRNARDFVVAQVIFATLTILRLFPAEKALSAIDRMARFIGPLTPRQKLVMANLANAFPEMTETERRAISEDMWASMGRLAGEYVFLDQLFDYDPARDGEGRIDVSGVPIFVDLLHNPRPFIVFTAHTGNFELLPIAAATFGLNVTVLFRPPNNPYVARRLFEARRLKSGQLVPSHAGAAWQLANALEAGNGVGMLVDQKFKKGLKTRFFGQPVQTNPLLAKLVRQYECDVYPARSIRMPDGRFRLEIEPAITIPRHDDGSVDVDATSQLLNDKVERWVREYPGQWQWFHDRWHIRKTL